MPIRGQLSTIQKEQRQRTKGVIMNKEDNTAKLGDILGFYEGTSLYMLAYMGTRQDEKYHVNLVNFSGTLKTNHWLVKSLDQQITIPDGTLEHGGPFINFGNGLEGIRNALNYQHQHRIQQ
jgi:hypothetical protein